MKSIKNDNKGFSLIEILVAIVVIALAGSYVLNGFVQAARMNAQAQRVQDATDLGQVTAEVFNRKSLAALLAGFINNGCLNGSDPTTIQIYSEDGTLLASDKQLVNTDNTASAVKEKLEAAGDNYEVRITGLPQSEIMADSSSQRYKIDVILKSGSYGINADKESAGYKKIDSTYKQLDKISQTVGSDQELFLNNFIVPDIRETTDNLVISSSDYDDSSAISQYIVYAANEYASLRTPPASLQYDQIYMQHQTDMRNYLGTVFPLNKITAATYATTIAPERTLDVTLLCKKEGTGIYNVYVLLEGKYKFNSFTYNGTTIPAKNITVQLITEADNKSFSFSTATASTDDVKKIYFYYNASDKTNGYYFSDSDKAVTGSKDKINLKFLAPTVPTDAEGDKVKKKLADSGFYIVTQKFKDASGNECVSLFQNNAYTINASSYAAFGDFKCYSNMMKWSGSEVERLATTGVSGIVTDGNKSGVNVYDMEISIKNKDREYANIKTVKGE